MQHHQWFRNIFHPAEAQAFSFKLVALPLSFLYRAVVFLRNFVYHSGICAQKKLPNYCISVGNITLGGSGKSPLVSAIAQHLRAQNLYPAILARGYASNLATHDYALLWKGQVRTKSGIILRGADEAFMQAAILSEVPIILGRKRFRAAQWFLSISKDTCPAPSHWLLDDGLQHLQLHRDVELVLLDYRQPFGTGQVFPLGTLRELPGALRRADAILLTRCPETAVNESLRLTLATYSQAPLLAIPFSNPQAVRVVPPGSCSPKNELASARLLALSGIAEPTQFMDSLRAQGLIPVEQLILADHQAITAEELQQRAETIDALITTAKDYFRMPEVFAACKKPVWILPLEATISYPQLHKLSPQVFP